MAGFDGIDLPWLDARLTTVVQDGHAKGRALGKMVADSLAGKTVRSRTFPTQFRAGGTTAAARR